MNGTHIEATPSERLITFGDGGRLVGTLSAGTDTGRPALLLFNAGVIPRTGPHRLNVKLARRFAAAGFGVLRFDLSGQGDSRPSTGTAGFERQAIEDLKQAMDATTAATGATRFLCFGICSGAVLGYAAALDDERIVGCAMFDPYMYPTARTHFVRILARVRQAGLTRIAGGWLRRRLAPAAAREAAASAPTPEGIDLGLRRPQKAAFAAGLAHLLDRGVALLLLHSGSALYTYNYRAQFDDGFRRYGLAGRVRADYLPAIDHTVTELAAQRFLIAHLLAWAEGAFPGTSTLPAQRTGIDSTDRRP
jgi:alpha-beta hydrolase superfamily lysophospholipase